MNSLDYQGNTSILVLAPPGCFQKTESLSDISESLAQNGNRIIFAEQQNQYLCSPQIQIIIDLAYNVGEQAINGIIGAIAYDLIKGLKKSIAPFPGGFGLNLRMFGRSKSIIAPRTNDEIAARMIVEALTEMYNEMQDGDSTGSVE